MPDEISSDPVEAAIQEAFAESPPISVDPEPLQDQDAASPDAAADEPFAATPDAAAAADGSFVWPEDLRREYGDLIDRHQGDPAKVFKTLREQGNFIASGAHKQPPPTPTLLPTMDMSDEELYALAEKRPTDAAMYVLERYEQMPQDVAQQVLNYWVAVEPWKAMQYQQEQLEARMQGYVQQHSQPQMEYLKHEWASRADNLLRERNADWNQWEQRVAVAIAGGQVAIPDRAYTSPEAMAEALEDVLGAIKYRDWLARARNAQASGAAQPAAPTNHRAATQTRNTAAPPATRQRDAATGQFVATDQDIVADIVGKADVIL